MKRTYFLALISLLFAGIFGGLGPIFAKLSLIQYSPFLVVSLRYIIALPLILPFILFRLKISPQDIKKMILNSLFWSGNAILFILAIRYTTSIMSQVMYFLVPLTVLLISKIFLQYKYKTSQYIAVLIGMLGGALIIANNLLDTQQHLINSMGTFKGNGLLLIAVLCWSLYLISSKEISQKYSPLVIVFYNNLITFLISLPISVFNIIFTKPNLIPQSLEVWIGILGIGIIMSIGMLLCYQWGIKHASAFTASFVNFINPIVAGLVAIPLFGEKLSWSLMVSSGLIAASVYLITIKPLITKNA